MDADRYKRFQTLSFADFKSMARNPELSKYEKIGFPDAYRQGKEELIWADILGKLPRLADGGKTVLDIGPGCSDLPLLLKAHCERHDHRLIWIDSAEMLTQLPDATGVRKIAAFYPDCAELFTEFSGQVDVILAYSLLHYVFQEGNVWAFLDASLSLLKSGGQLLLGDIPNVSKRKRFFASDTGVQFHQEFMQTEQRPEVAFNTLEPEHIDDSVVFGLLQRARNQGFDAYVVPQADGLPMANRREDLLICRP